MRLHLYAASLLVGVSIFLSPHLSLAADYPEKPIRLIVPFPPGGGTDAMARLVGQYLSEEIGQPIVIDNRGGAGGNIAMQAAATAPDDGYTLFFATTGTMTINPALYKEKMQVKPLVDFEPIGTAVLSSHVVIVNNDLPAGNVRELIALAKSKPGDLTFGSSGNGGAVHLTGELFKQAAQIQMLHVPYKGSAPALADLMGGRIDMIFDVTPGDLPYITSGRVKALAVTTAKRIPALPDVPTVQESGLPGFVSTSWFGLVVPKGTPPEAKARLVSALAAALSHEELQKKLVSLGAQAFPGTPEDFARLLQDDTVKWAALVESSSATIE
jgi:tripartite-type tricarboxylate transporter receptor subunit TctC